VADAARGSIYDLGYQHYTGVRLGRPYAVWSLYLYSLRVVFGIGRSFWAKLAAFGLLAFALLPAIVQLGVASLSPDDIEVVPPEDYYGIIEPILAIFVAIIAPELAARDQRTRTLSLYFSRALRRSDYALAKFAALVTALLAITVIPQLLMFVGNMSAASDTFEYFTDNFWDLPAIILSAVLLSSFFSGIGLAIAAQTSRRTYSTVAIVAVLTLSVGIATAIFESSGPDSGRWALLFSPYHLVRGTTLWLFGADTGEDNPELEDADFPGVLYALTVLAITLFTLIAVLRRYERVQA
jgi:ABC-2 type transport system permease protein